jgi:hypothetical protein
LNVYVPLPGMSLWFGAGCTASVTTPNETDWHELEADVSAEVAKPPPAESGLADPPTASGHVRLQGQSGDGPFELDADFYFDIGVKDPCIRLPG